MEAGRVYEKKVYSDTLKIAKKGDGILKQRMGFIKLTPEETKKFNELMLPMGPKI